jgi:hypothetical protein
MICRISFGLVTVDDSSQVKSRPQPWTCRRPPEMAAKIDGKSRRKAVLTLENDFRILPPINHMIRRRGWSSKGMAEAKAPSGGESTRKEIVHVDWSASGIGGQQGPVILRTTER